MIQKTILLAEDENNIAKFIIEELDEALGSEVKVIHFADGLSAYNHLSNTANNVDLIISCIYMPKMDGVRLLKKSKELRPEIPFIFFTVVDFSGEVQVKNADAYILKSNDTFELISWTEELLHLLLPKNIN